MGADRGVLSRGCRGCCRGGGCCLGDGVGDAKGVDVVHNRK